MSLAELVILSVKVEGRSKSEVARDYKISRYWVQQLVKLYDAEGEAAFQARSRRPLSNPRSISLDLEDQIIRLRARTCRRRAWTRAQKPSAVTSTHKASPGSRRPRRSGGC
jgi:transposase